KPSLPFQTSAAVPSSSPSHFSIVQIWSPNRRSGSPEARERSCSQRPSRNGDSPSPKSPISSSAPQVMSTCPAPTTSSPSSSVSVHPSSNS
ncbi:hypothetical protein LINPERPRIM_LOCUS37413, partial [Linum perenne]